MMEEIGCLIEPIMIGDEAYEPIRWGDERESKAWRGVIDFPCRDCRTPPGGVHHPGCCVERCPACRGQAISCGCFADPDGEDWDDDPPYLAGRLRGRRKDRCVAHQQPQHYRT
jgi:hypothetical protein